MIVDTPTQLGAAQGLDLTEPTDESTTPPGAFVLPNYKQPISKAAKEIFSVIAPTQTLFIRGNVITELFNDIDGLLLRLVQPDRFRSLIEGYGHIVCGWKFDQEKNLVLQPRNCSADNAKALLAAREGLELLPPVKIVVHAPIITVDGKILGKGYHAIDGGVLVTGGDMPPIVPIKDSVSALSWLLEEYDFQSLGDRARALAALITPALKAGGHLRESIPLSVVEADVSQAGKTHLQKVVRELYRARAYPIAPKKGGVGSLDESISAALLSGYQFVAIDNVRGKTDSQFLEMILTWGGPVAARVPHRGEEMIDATAITFQLTSNGAEMTQDLANRSSIVRIRKRAGFTYRGYAEGNLIHHIKARQPYYLGCIFAIIREWLRLGRPATKETRHDFREWAGIMDYISQHILQAGPLLDGHEAAQGRVSDPALTWLRRVVLAIVKNGQTGIPLAAHQIYRLCEETTIEIPGLQQKDEETGRKVIGSLMAKCFGSSDVVEVDHLVITRQERTETNKGGNPKVVKRYTVLPRDTPEPTHPRPIDNIEISTDTPISTNDIGLGCLGYQGCTAAPTCAEANAVTSLTPQPVSITVPLNREILARVIQPRGDVSLWTIQMGNAEIRLPDIVSDQPAFRATLEEFIKHNLVLVDARPLLACCHFYGIPLPKNWADLRVMSSIVHNGLPSNAPQTDIMTELLDSNSNFDPAKAIDARNRLLVEIIQARLFQVYTLEHQILVICDRMGRDGLLIDAEGLAGFIEGATSQNSGDPCAKAELAAAKGLFRSVGMDGRVHPDWTYSIAQTGRLKCARPAIQSLHRSLRRYIVAAPGHTFVRVDYAQADIRPLAFASQCPALKACLQPGGDFYRSLASVVFQKDINQVTDEERKISKLVGIAIPYGMGAAKVATALKCSLPAAGEFITKYFARLPELGRWLDNIAANPCAEAHSLKLRRRRILDIDLLPFERTNRVVNMIGQGTVADAIKTSMVRISSILPPGSQLVLNLHDEQVVETPDADALKVAQLVQRTMERSLAEMIPGVPVVTKVSFSKNLGPSDSKATP